MFWTEAIQDISGFENVIKIGNVHIDPCYQENEYCKVIEVQMVRWDTRVSQVPDGCHRFPQNLNFITMHSSKQAFSDNIFIQGKVKMSHHNGISSKIILRFQPSVSTINSLVLAWFSVQIVCILTYFITAFTVVFPTLGYWTRWTRLQI